MKKLLIFALALMLLLPLLVGCDTAENDPPPTNDETENDTSVNDGNDGNDVPPANDGGDEVLMGEGGIPTGAIRGNLTYNGLSVEMLLTTPLTNVLDILGEPQVHLRDVFVFESGLQFTADSEMPNSPLSSFLVRNDTFFAPTENLHLLELSGVALNMPRTEIIANLGEPFRQGETLATYYVVGNEINLRMDLHFRFNDNSEDISKIVLFQVLHCISYPRNDLDDIDRSELYCIKCGDLPAPWAYPFCWLECSPFFCQGWCAGLCRPLVRNERLGIQEIEPDVWFAIGLADQALLSQFDNYIDYTDKTYLNSANYYTIALISDTTLNNFKFFTVNSAITPESEVDFSVNQILVSLDELPYESPLVVIYDNSYLGGNFRERTHGISFTDSDNTVRYFSISSASMNDDFFISEFFS